MPVKGILSQIVLCIFYRSNFAVSRIETGLSDGQRRVFDLEELAARIIKILCDSRFWVGFFPKPVCSVIVPSPDLRSWVSQSLFLVRLGERPSVSLPWRSDDVRLPLNRSHVANREVIESFLSEHEKTLDKPLSAESLKSWKAKIRFCIESDSLLHSCLLQAFPANREKYVKALELLQLVNSSCLTLEESLFWSHG